MSHSDPHLPGPIPMTAINGSWDLADAGTRWALAWFDLQRSLAQPWLDLQVSLLEHCASWTWPGPASCFQRGTEQLA